jgi:trimethylamine---corrinoid protein Co-methyltransferase
MEEKLNLDILSASNIDLLTEKCKYFLEHKGIRLDSEKGLKTLEERGAKVDHESRMVSFSEEIIEKALKTVPKKVTLTGGYTCPDSEGFIYGTSETGANFYFDPETNARKDVTLDDVKQWSQVIEKMDGIQIQTYASPTDVPGKTADIHALKTLFENCSKHIMVHPFSFESVPYLFELAIASAGSKEELRKNPRFNVICTSTAPFVFKAMDYEIIDHCCEYGQYVLAASLTTAGATAPVTIAGQVLQCGIEILAMLVISQMIKPGTPVIGNPFIFTLNMSTGRNLLATPEALIAESTACELVKKGFGIPVAMNGLTTDSHIMDEQASMNVMLGSLLGATNQAVDILISAGSLSTILCVSPVKMIADNRIMKMVNYIRKGLTINEDTLAWDQLLEAKPGSHFLKSAHTLKHCRDGLRLDLLPNLSYDAWQTQGSKGFYDLAKVKFDEMKKDLKPLGLPSDVVKELNSIVERADRELAN